LDWRRLRCRRHRDARGLLSLGEPPPQVVNRAPLSVERPLERIDPARQPHLFQEADDWEDGDNQADQREK